MVFSAVSKGEVRKISQTDDYVVMDAEVVLIKDTSCILGDKYIFVKKPILEGLYFKVYKDLFTDLGNRQTSYIADYMIFNKKIIDEMIIKIEDLSLGKKWYEVVMTSVINGTHFMQFPEYLFSEHETYGCYME